MPNTTLEKRKSNIFQLKRKDDDVIGRDSTMNDNEDHYQPLTKPRNQLQLTELELQEEITRVLRATNPSAPNNIVRYSFKERQYKPIPHLDQAVIHFSMDSNLVSKDFLEIPNRQSAPTSLDNSIGILKEDIETDIDMNIGDPENSLKVSQTSLTFPQQKTNLLDDKTLNSADKFRFCSRATQTLNNPLQTKTTQSEYPPRKNFSENLDQAVIYDSYSADFKAQIQVNKTRLIVLGESQKTLAPNVKRIQVPHEKHYDDISHLLPAVQILERMLNLNTYDEIAQDFSYYEDPADEYKLDSHGTLLPLWKFSYEKTKKMPVTSISWCTIYKDLFIVSHGTYDIVSYEKCGAICGYSLKNPSYPECIIFTKSPVLSVDVNEMDNNLVCAGLLDGGVMVISLYKKQKAINTPVILNSSSMHNMKHRDPCWQVKWHPVELDNTKSFYSVSGDGRISEWTFNKYELTCQNIILLDQVDLPKEIHNMPNTYLESGTCLAIHPKKHHAFLVGTQDGNIYYHPTVEYDMKSCSPIVVAFNKSIHKMIIYQVAWSCWHPDVFASCSADWTIGIWSCKQCDPLIILDLGFPVSSIAWAPYSSTVLAAATVDRKVRVYDFSIDRMEPLVCQTVGSNKQKTSLTSIVFCEKFPIILVGDTRGNIHSMKLSPNLRKMPKLKRGETINMEEYQFNKMENIIHLLT